MPSSSLVDSTGLESGPLFVRFRIPGAEVPGQGVPLPDLLARGHFQTMTKSMRQKITRTKTLGGFVQEHWPDEVDSIAAQASTGAFMMASPTEGGVDASLRRASFVNSDAEAAQMDGGLAIGNQVILRRLTNAAVNLEALVHFYKNNGVYWEQDGQVGERHNIEMYYMKSIYLGYFMDLNVNHTDTDPNRFTFSFNFKVLDTLLG